MHHRIHLCRRLLIGASMLASLSCAHAQLIVDGGFEVPALTDPGVTWAGLPGAGLTGWTSVSSLRGAILFIEPFSPVSQGKQAVELEVPGDAISQTFATVVGSNYRLTFDLSAFVSQGGPGLGSAPCPCTSVVDVTVGPASERFWGNNASWVSESLDFTADSSFTTLTFTNPALPSHYGNYPHLDNVSVFEVSPDRLAFHDVSPVPEPETYALILGGLALLRWRTKAAARRAA
jgi:Protein of unknown function (DUF642)